MFIAGIWMLFLMERESRQSTVYHVSATPSARPVVVSLPARPARPRLYVLPPLD
jgi:hypothetical protein